MFSLAAFSAMPPDQRYFASVSEITNYNSTVASQSAPAGLPGGQPGITAGQQALAAAQSASLQWFNQVYPASLNVPQTIVSEAGSITSGLSELTSVASQYAADPGNSQLQTALTNAANSLAGQVQTLQSSCATLSTSLAGYSGALQSVAQQLGNAIGALQATMSSLQAQLNNDLGNLDSLEHATCPNSGDINAAQQVVQTDQGYLQATYQFLNQLNNFGQNANGALAGLSYLAGTWTQLASIAGSSLSALQQISNQPAVVVQLDLSQASQAWQSLVDRLSSITQLAAQAQAKAEAVSAS
ncbi:MAG: hypothetical protein ABI140_06915 [Jatrophihabitantaceae bacterium]